MTDNQVLIYVEIVLLLSLNCGVFFGSFYKK